jgi:hypothetical protein
MTRSTPDTSIKLTCRCSAPTRPLPCVGGCSTLCQRLIAERDHPGFTAAQIAAGLSTPVLMTTPRLED